MSGKLHIIGVGPGDPELLTLKGLRLLKDCPVYLAPKARENGKSTALEILSQVVDIDAKEIIQARFPMEKIKMGQAPPPKVQEAWQSAARAVLAHLENGKDVAFPTLGDPAIYSTGLYLSHTLQELYPEAEVEIVPGVSSVGACAAASGLPLCLGDDMLAVVPATFADERLRAVLQEFDAIVLMKVHRAMKRVLPILEELGLVERAILVERLGQRSQRIIRDVREAAEMELHYFATMIIR